VAYPVESSTLPGKEEYKQDDKGNIVQMTLRADDGSILSMEKYQYEFDELGNWKKMTSSVAVFENGQVSYEPIEATYRMITYYYNQAVAKIVSPRAGAAVATTSSTAPEVQPARLTADKPETGKQPETKSDAAAVTKTLKTEEEKPSKPDEVKPGVTSIGSATAENVPSSIPVVHVSEETLRKAAIELPEAEYPTEAMLAGVEGKIEVQFIVDQKGEVASAQASSGHPLLVAAAEEAAHRARFSALTPMGQAAKVFGIITYNFALPRPETASNTPAPALGESAKSTAVSNDNEARREAAPPSEPAENKITTPAKENSSPSVAAAITSSGAANTSPGAAKNSPPETPVYKLSSATPFEKGMASLNSGKYPAAVEFFSRAVQSDPKDAVAYCKLGLAHSALQHHKEAIDAFRAAIQVNRAFVDADSYFRLGSAYISVGDQAAAVKPLKTSLYMIRAQELDTEKRKPAQGTPTLLDVEYALGLAFYGSGSFREAAKEFKEAVRLKQDFASAHYGLGLSYLSFGDKAGAEKEERVLRALKSPLADKLTNMLLIPGFLGRNKVF